MALFVSFSSQAFSSSRFPLSSCTLNTGRLPRGLWWAATRTASSHPASARAKEPMGWCSWKNLGQQHPATPHDGIGYRLSASQQSLWQPAHQYGTHLGRKERWQGAVLVVTWWQKPWRTLLPLPSEAELSAMATTSPGAAQMVHTLPWLQGKYPMATSESTSELCPSASDAGFWCLGHPCHYKPPPQCQQ